MAMTKDRYYGGSITGEVNLLISCQKNVQTAQTCHVIYMFAGLLICQSNAWNPVSEPLNLLRPTSHQVGPGWDLLVLVAVVLYFELLFELLKYYFE